MPRPAVYIDVMKVVERRIAEGDYMLKELPGERKLAEEVGVSYMTARKAVTGLIEKGVLTRKPNGTLTVDRRKQRRKKSAQIALLTPAYPSTHFVHCRLAISQAAEKAGAQFRPVEFMHWHDPVVSEAMHGSDGLLVIPSTEPIPPLLLKEFVDPQHKVVIFDADMTEHRIPSIRLWSREHIYSLFDHLLELGYQHIDCLNAQGRNNEIDRRIDHWEEWRSRHDVSGELWDHPVSPFGDPTAQAYNAMTQRIKDANQSLEAVVCTTQPAALGAIRACREAGLEVGRDVAVCTINNEPTGRFFCPSLTGLEMPDIAPLLQHCFEWFAKPGRLWTSDLKIVPDDAKLFKGESTGR